MISNKLGDFLATMELVRTIDGVAERDASIIESRQSRENAFLGQVMQLAQIEEAAKPTGEGATKYSDGQVTLTFDDPKYAATILRLAKELGASEADIVPEKHDGLVSLHVLPHVFASEEMSTLRGMLELGVEEAQVKDFRSMVQSLDERRNPYHDKAKGRFTSQDKIKNKNGSGSFQLANPQTRAGGKIRAGELGSYSWNKPAYHANRQWMIRGAKTPCGRLARKHVRDARNLPPLRPQDYYRRCSDGQIPDWAVESTAAEAAKMVLAQVMRANAAKAAK